MIGNKDINPYSNKYTELKNDIDKLKSLLSDVSSELDVFNSIKIEEFSRKPQLLELDIEDHKSSLDKLKKREEEYLEKYKFYGSLIKSRLNPLGWFDSDQKYCRESRGEYWMNYILIRGEISKAEKELSELESEKLEVNKKISWYGNFDCESFEKKRVDLLNDIERGEKELESVNLDKINLENILRPIRSEIRKYEANISKYTSDMKKAKAMEDDLSCEGRTSYDRKMIHEECERLFGNGSPGKILSKSKSALEYNKNNIKKLHSRAEYEIKKFQRKITSIVIDGNNMCYQQGKFVGIDPLVSLSEVLRDQYKITVIFDSDIRSLLKKGDDEIRSMFVDGVSVHPTSTGQKADKTILDLAENDDHAYVLSNDRFSEYQDCKAVFDDRLIRHEIVDGKVIVNDLDVNVEW